MKTDSTRSPTETERSLRLTHIVEDVIRCRSDGERVNDEAVIDAHPELAPELKEQLCELRQVEEAEQRAKSVPAPQSISAG